MAEARTVLVASGDRLFADAASHLIRSRGWNVVGTVTDGLQALAALNRETASTVLVIGELPRLGPTALARQVRRRWPDIGVVVFGDQGNAAATSVPADANADAIVEALAAPPRVGTDRQTARPDNLAVLRSLTSRERLVLKQLAEGMSGPDIARQLGVSQHTVRTHMQNLYAKLHAHSKLDVVRFAAQHGLVHGDAGEQGQQP
jgi:DNA-binding NarL/FixJ family response regulator